MNLVTLKNFVSKLGFIFERTKHSYGYDIDIVKTLIEDIDLDGEKVEEFKIEGTVVMDMGNQNKETISFVSFLTRSSTRLEFQSSYKVGNNDDSLGSNEELKSEDTFRIFKQSMESNFIPKDNKFLVHMIDGKINKVYSVPNHYKFENGINDSVYTLLNLYNPEMFNCVNSACGRRGR